MAAVSGENEDKCPKRLKKDDDTLCLSDLPDEVLLHILSYLPTTKSVVATSVLSRRWQHLWKYNPNLQLNQFQFIPQRNLRIDKFQLDQQRDRFINFAERSLAARGGTSLVSFSLTCEVRNYASHFDNWICSAVQLNVEQLSLDFLDPVPSSLCLPSCLFVCQSLVKLNLDLFKSITVAAIRFPSVICLPRLKYLKLKKVEFADNNFSERLLSHPLLEELILCDCGWAKVSATINVNSPKLQRLSIKEDRDKGDKERKICFIGDNLRFFWYEGFVCPTQYCICGSTMQLREAGILFDDKFLDIDVVSERYCKLINSFSMVQNLTLSDPAAKGLYLLSCRPELETTIPVFERVTRLNLSCYFYPSTTISIDSVQLQMIFDRCPHLEQLNFMRVHFSCRKVDTPLLKPMPLCFRTHLKKITLCNYDDSECKEQADVIHVLLHRALTLEEIILHCKISARISSQKVAELEREFNTCPKISQNCRVSVVLD